MVPHADLAESVVSSSALLGAAAREWGLPPETTHGGYQERLRLPGGVVGLVPRTEAEIHTSAVSLIVYDESI